MVQNNYAIVAKKGLAENIAGEKNCIVVAKPILPRASRRKHGSKKKYTNIANQQNGCSKQKIDM
jgi:hypothetical protein